MKNILVYIVLLLSSVLCGCRNAVSVEEYNGPLVIGADTIDSLRLCHTFDSLIEADHDRLVADKAMRQYYTDHHRLCWFSNKGVLPQADTLMMFLRKVGDTGFDPSHFFGREIAEDRLRLDSLDFSQYDVYTVIARMDMLMTKAFLRYEGYLHYGVCRPMYMMNCLDRNMTDTTVIRYRQLYGIPTEEIGKQGFAHLASLAGTDSVAPLLRDAEPKSALYKKLKQQLKTATGADRDRIMVNMERCRWRHPHYPSEFDKYVLVNIPTYQLFAVDGDSIMSMKVVCGSWDTKTPLVHSFIKRMDLNPRWVIPSSIVKKDIARHAGNTAYFARHRYHIFERATGKDVSVGSVSSSMLLSGDYRVAQEGGEGNSLGRIIFRFDNNFSIYLHDTSTKWTFQRDDRRASHGCVRVERPYDLACFLLKDKDPELMDKIQYSMTADMDSTNLENDRIVHYIKLDPQIPVFITYYTMYIMPDGQLHTYHDVYDYDPAVLKELEPFIAPK